MEVETGSDKGAGGPSGRIIQRQGALVVKPLQHGVEECLGYDLVRLGRGGQPEIIREGVRRLPGYAANELFILDGRPLSYIDFVQGTVDRTEDPRPEISNVERRVKRHTFRIGLKEPLFLVGPIPPLVWVDDYRRVGRRRESGRDISDTAMPGRAAVLFFESEG